MTKYMSAPEIVNDLVNTLTDDDIKEWQKMPKSDLIMLHHSLGQYIRNHYKLWERENPLTSVWVIDNESGNETYIKDGVDCHPNHPDQMSFSIIENVWDRLNSVTANDDELSSFIDKN